VKRLGAKEMSSGRWPLGCLTCHLLLSVATVAGGSGLRAEEGRSGVSPQAISLPTGPGSIEGLGESFEPQLNTGSYTFQVPMKLPAVRGAADPSFAIAYNSANGNGPLGLGWKLSSPWIQRQTDKGLPHYDARDTYITAGGEELVALADGSFRAENEGTFILYEPLSDGSWKATRPDGAVMFFGASSQSRLNHPSGVGTFRWMLESVEDRNGNRCEYVYAQDSQQIYLKEVRYGLHASAPSEFFVVSFNYAPGRPDPFTDYRGRFRCETRLLLESVTVSLSGRRIRHWQFRYHPNTLVSLLQSFTVFGDQRSSIGEGAAVNVDYLPPITFSYTESALGGALAVQSMGGHAPSLALGEAELGDINRDGLPDLFIRTSEGFYESSLNTGDSFAAPQAFQQFSLPPIQAGPDADSIRLMDLRGDGSVDCLVDQGGDLYFREFVGPTEFGPDSDYVRAGNFSLRDPQVQLVDINNDRAIDFIAPDLDGFSMLLTNPADGTSNVFYPSPSDPAPSALASLLADSVDFSAGWRFADMNGDRMLDLVAIGTAEGGGTVYYPSLGYGEFDVAVTMLGGPADADLGPRGVRGCDIVDVNGDGLGDLVHVDSGLVRIWGGIAGQSFAAIPLTVDGVPDYVEGRTAVRFADINGNGSTDILWNDPSVGVTMAFLDMQPGGRPHHLGSMHNGMGRSLSIEYSNSVALMRAAEAQGDPWQLKPPFPMTVVTGFVEGDGSGNFYRTSLSYRDAFYDGREREFRGFRTAVRTDWGDDSQGAPTLVTHHVFDTGNVHESLKGKPLSIERRTLAGGLFDRVSTRWQARELPLSRASEEGRSITFAHPVSETTVISELGQGEAISLFKEYEYDDYGNQTLLADHGRSGGTWDDERFTRTTYSSSSAQGLSRWIVSLPVNQKITDENGLQVAETKYIYDDSGAPGTVSKGNLTSLMRSVDAGGSSFVSEGKRYDVYGNPTSIIDPLGSGPGSPNSRTIGYDSQIHTYPSAEIVHVGGDSGDLSASASYDVGLGTVSSSADFNGNTTSYGHDTFGRLTAIIKPGDSAGFPTESYSYLLGQQAGGRILNSISVSKRETSGGASVDSRLFFDGLGRKVMVRSEGSDGGQSVVTDHVTYNARKGVHISYLPYFSSGLDYAAGGGAATETRYDALGRAVKVTQPDTGNGQVYSSTTYQPLVRFVQDEEQTKGGSKHNGAGMGYVYDGLLNDDGEGRLREAIEVVKIGDDGTSSGSAAEWKTQYTYDLLDNLTGITDSQQNYKSMKHDALSRMTFMDDPNRGTLDYQYDAASNLRETTDAKGQVIKMTYDGANRLLTEDYLDDAGHSPDVSYKYDSGGSNVKGRLAEVVDLSGQEALSYDSRGRVISKIKSITHPSNGALSDFETGYSYDSMDRITAVFYPDGDSVNYGYDSRGLPDWIRGTAANTIISSMSYDPSGQAKSIAYGNGVETSYDYDARLRMTSLDTIGPSGPLISFGYTLDDASNILRIDDKRSGISSDDPRQNTQVFEYDDLYRITSVTYPSLGDGISYRYDRIGNMLSKESGIQHLERGLSVTHLGTMSYGGSAGASGRSGGGNQPGPHALTAVSEGERSFSYDANGNMEEIDGMRCSWDFKDRLVTVENEEMRAEYSYDYADRRVLKVVTPKIREDPQSARATEVLYPARFYEVREHGEPIKYVWNGDTRVARVTKNLNGSSTRTQKVHLHPGANILCLAVSLEDTGTKLVRDPVTDIYRYEPSDYSYHRVGESEALPAGTILRVSASSEAVIDLRGSYTLPSSPVNYPSGRHWIGNPRFEPLDVSEVFPADTTLWYFDSQVQDWRLKYSGPVEVVSDAPDTLALGEAAFVVTSQGFEFTAPITLRGLQYYHQDHLGSSIVRSDSSGGLISETSYYPYGSPKRSFAPRSSGVYGYTQKELDKESQLSYFEARYLATQYAKFLSVDPFYDRSPLEYERPQILNFYSYTLNNPVVYIDPDGKKQKPASSKQQAAQTQIDENVKNIGRGAKIMSGVGEIVMKSKNRSAQLVGIALKQQGSSLDKAADAINLSKADSIESAAEAVFSLGVGAIAAAAGAPAAASLVLSELADAWWDGMNNPNKIGAARKRFSGYNWDKLDSMSHNSDDGFRFYKRMNKAPSSSNDPMKSMDKELSTMGLPK